jgi:hypothetical protein
MNEEMRFSRLQATMQELAPVSIEPQGLWTSACS